MNIENVIELGKIDYDTSIFSLDYWVWWSIIICAVLLFVISAIRDWEGLGFYFCVALFTFVGLIIFNYFSDDAQKNKMIDTWKQEYAMPYIKTLPIKQSEIIYIKIDPEIKTTVYGNVYYTNSRHDLLTPITVSYKVNGEIHTYSNWFSAKMVLSKSEIPYIEYRQLEQDLGNDLYKGIYDAIIYLPENYGFTEIK